jgi:signal transduction histidine kinase
MRERFWTERSKSAIVLHGGYGVLLVLLGLAAYQALRLQNTGEATRVGVYEAFLEREESLAELRRAVWSGASIARDFLLSQEEEREEEYRQEIAGVKVEAERALAELESQDRARLARLQLRSKVSAYLEALSRMGEAGADEEGQPRGRLRRLLPLRASALGAIEEFTRQVQEETRQELARVAAQRREQARQLLWMLGLMLVFGVTVAWFTFRYVRHREAERQRHHEQTEWAKREFERLSARLLEVQEEERRMLARELHDEVGQTLTALRMEIAHAGRAAVEPETRSRLERARGLAERCVQMVRNISVMLRPSLLDDLGLAAALQWQAEEMGRRSGVAVRFEANDSGENLSDRLKTCIFRIAQEALNNSEKYAQARQIAVKLEVEQERVTLEVEDDGVGFELNEHAMPRWGTGLFGIRERVSQLGGRLSIETGVGKGTRLRVVMPLVEAEAARVVAG